MIPGDLLSAFPHRQFHTLLDSWAALPNSYPNALRAMQGGSLYHFYDGLWYDPVERRTHDLPCERRTRYRLSQPDTVTWRVLTIFLFVICNFFCGQNHLLWHSCSFTDRFFPKKWSIDIIEDETRLLTSSPSLNPVNREKHSQCQIMQQDMFEI